MHRILMDITGLTLLIEVINLIVTPRNTLAIGLLARRWGWLLGHGVPHWLWNSSSLADSV